MDNIVATLEVSQNPTEMVAHHIEKALQMKGVTVPSGPDDSFSHPREWLLRGEASPTKLYSTDKLEPQSGEMGTWGVFFADCLSALYKYQEGGIYYVVPTSKITEPWLRTPSTDYEKLFRETAQKYQLNPNSIGGGVETEQKLFKSHNIYQAKRGIATTHTPIPLGWAKYILVDTHGKQIIDKDRIPPEIMEKIIEI